MSITFRLKKTPANNWLEEKGSKLKPLGWIPSLVIFLFAAAVLRITHYVVVPALKSATGQPYLVGYLVGWGTTMSLVFAAALAAYKLEGHPVRRNAFVRRYRLGTMTRMDWLWVIGMILFSTTGLAALSFTWKPLISLPLTAPHPAFPPDFVDFFNNSKPGVLWEMPLKGKWWIVGVYFVGWVLNILGEELWYRGWMLPRQEIAFGKYAWLVNGLMFNFQHTFQPWNLLAILPGSLFVAYAVQRQGKTWMSIIWHGLLNLGLLVFIIQGVIL